MSSGELEVLKDQENSRKPNLGRLDADTALHNIPTDFILSDIKVPMKLKLVKNQKGRSSKEIQPQNKAPSSLTSPESEVITGVRMRCIKVKPPWEPSSMLLAALETFKNSFQKMNIVMGKSGALPSQVAMIMSTDACTTHLLQPIIIIPTLASPIIATSVSSHIEYNVSVLSLIEATVCLSSRHSQLEPLLFSLDRTIKSCQGDTVSLHSTSGYLESVVQILGMHGVCRYDTTLTFH